jgi:predicted ATPase with chaperone activity
MDGSMKDLLGEDLVKEKVITEEQLERALERQKLQGGRLGRNLIDLGFLSQEELIAFFKKHPDPPETLRETGLDLPVLCDLVLKHILFKGEFTIADISASVKLPMAIVNSALEELRRQKFIEVKGASQFAKTSYQFQITGQGKNRAAELLDICRYVGPAPVVLDHYSEMVDIQTIKHIVVSEDAVIKGFSSLIMSESMLKRLGPAISSGKAMFLYGPPGNGKTTIAETIGSLLPGTVYIPYSLIVGGQIISVFDPVTHISVPNERAAHTVDQRWVLIKRPVVMMGGELSLRMLDLDFNSIAKFYEAPLQMKANNGLFIVDDFGRQQVSPQSLLNRWIVPLERRRDFMSLHTGMKFDIPFDQLVIFATNIEPAKLVDEAFLRRIRYKVKVTHPTEEEFEAIFRKVCESHEIEFRKDAFNYLVKSFYRKLGVKFNACHPRDLIDHIRDDAYYYNRPPRMSNEALALAWENYFVEM